MIFNYLGLIGIVGALGLTYYFLNYWKANHKGNLYLGLFLVLVSINNVYFVISRHSNLLLNIPYLVHAMDGLRLLWGVLLFFFARAYTGENPLKSRWVFLHFLPAGLAIGYFFYRVWHLSDTSQASYTSSILQHKSAAYRWYWIMVYFSNVGYLTASLLNLGRIRLLPSTTFTELEKKRYNWLFSSIIVLMAIHFVIPLIYRKFEASMFVFMPIFVAVLSLAFIWKIYKEPAIFREITIEKPLDEGRFSVAYPTLEAAKTALLTFVEEEKPYLKPDLNVRTLSEAFGVPSYQVSQIINLGLQKNFFDLVNYYRVEEAKAKLVDKQYNHLTLEGIGYECGFNSKSSFYSVFKKYTQQTPSEFRKNALEQ